MNKRFSNKKLTIILVFIFILISIYPLFAFLDSLPLRTWDESRVAASSYEMTKSSNPLVITFDNQPDHWSVKPPLTIWTQALSIKIFGPSELAVRLPSALSIMLLGIIIILLFSKLKKPFIGFYTSLIIICTKGILYYHFGRNADYDAMLTLFIISYAISLFVFTENKQKKYYLLFFLFLILATLTKGIQALIPLPFILIYILFRKQFLEFLRNKYTYFGILGFILIIGGYYFGREIFDSGYLKAVYENELGGRYLKVLEEHQHGRDFYITELKNSLFTYFFWLVPPAILINLITKDKLIRRISNYALGMSLIILIVITIGKTKLTWYVFPILPLLAIILGCSLSTVQEYILRNIKNRKLGIGIIIIGIMALFFSPYKEITKHFYKPGEGEYEAYYSRHKIMNKLIDREIEFNESIVYISQDNQQDLIFYLHAMDHYGILNKKKDIQYLEVGEIVQINEPEIDKEVRKRFEYDTLYHHIQSKLVRLTELKEINN